MNQLAAAYLPERTLPVIVAALLATALAGGLALSRKQHPGSAWRALAWGFTLALIVAVERLTAGAPVGFRMLAIIGVALWAMKSVVSVESAAAGEAPLTPIRWLAFAALWPGMRPELFAAPLARDGAGARSLALRGLGWLACGAALLFGARTAFALSGSRVLATVLALPAVSLVLHFGAFNLGAASWRLVGLPCDRLFIAPLASGSLGEFWGRRWNLAFTEMTQIAVYRPAAARLGRNTGAVLGFAFSGLLHEMAISLPAGRGFGLPLLYFLVHGGLVLVERRWRRQGRPIDQRPVLRHVWTLAWLALPMPILFHPPFLAGVVWPLVGAG